MQLFISKVHTLELGLRNFCGHAPFLLIHNLKSEKESYFSSAVDSRSLPGTSILDNESPLAAAIATKLFYHNFY